jgi:hypothetical protein
VGEAHRRQESRPRSRYATCHATGRARRLGPLATAGRSRCHRTFSSPIMLTMPNVLGFADRQPSADWQVVLLSKRSPSCLVCSPSLVPDTTRRG